MTAPARQVQHQTTCTQCLFSEVLRMFLCRPLKLGEDDDVVEQTRGLSLS